MILYYIATHHIFMWIAVALAVIGNLFVQAFLKEAFFPRYAVYDRQMIQREAHKGIIGEELMLIALVIGGIYAACYPEVKHIAILATYFVWFLAMAVLVMVGVSRMKSRQLWWQKVG